MGKAGDKIIQHDCNTAKNEYVRKLTDWKMKARIFY